MLRVLQVNLNHAHLAHNLLDQTIRERGVGLVIASEPHDRRGGAEWFRDATGKAAVAIPTGSNVSVSRVGDVGNGFVEIEAYGIRWYSCYHSPNTNIQQLRDYLRQLEASIRAGSGEVVIAGDFNAHSTLWGSQTGNERGEELGEFLSALDLQVINVGSVPTFVGQGRGTIVDVTLASASAARRIVQWEVLLDENGSNHRYVEFIIHERAPRRAAPEQRGWALRKLDEDKFRATYIRELPHEDPQTAEEGAIALTRAIAKACDEAMPRRRAGPDRRPAYWWNDEIAEKRRECTKARRKATRAARRGGNDAALYRHLYKEKKKLLSKSIASSKSACLEEFRTRVNSDPWGLPYKMVTGKLKSYAPIPELRNPERAQAIVHALFPDHPPLPEEEWWEAPEETPEFSLQELDRAIKRLPSGKAPGPDMVPNEILRLAYKIDPMALLDMYNRCLRSGVFPRAWKVGRLVLLRKGDKPLDQPSSYRPLVMLNTVGKVLERLLVNRIEEHLEGLGEEGLSTQQFGFRKGKSTVDAAIALTAEADLASGHRAVCAVVGVDIRNAFNTARWRLILDALLEKQVPRYIVRIIRDYLRDRSITFQTEEGQLQKDLSSGAPQGSVLGPPMWNLMYDGLLRIELPEGVIMLGFADDIALVARARTSAKVQEMMNDALERTASWLDRAGLEVAVHKTELVVFTSKYEAPPAIELRGTQLVPSNTIKYLGLQIDRRLTFLPHVRAAAEKASRVVDQLARLMPNVGGPKQKRRKLLNTVAHSVLLYGAPVWGGAAEGAGCRKILARAQRKACIREICAYSSISTAAALAIAASPPLDLVVKMRCALYDRKKAGASKRELNRAKKMHEAELLRVWSGRWRQDEEAAATDSAWRSEETAEWTRTLIRDLGAWHRRKHGGVNFHLTQVLSGHGCFNSYLHRIGKAPSPLCSHCDLQEDTAGHTLFQCPVWSPQRERLLASLQRYELTEETLVPTMLENPEQWRLIQEFVDAVMLEKEDAERERQSQGRRRRGG